MPQEPGRHSVQGKFVRSNLGGALAHFCRGRKLFGDKISPAYEFAKGHVEASSPFSL